MDNIIDNFLAMIMCDLECAGKLLFNFPLFQKDHRWPKIVRLYRKVNVVLQQ